MIHGDVTEELTDIWDVTVPCVLRDTYFHNDLHEKGERLFGALLGPLASHQIGKNINFQSLRASCDGASKSSKVATQWTRSTSSLRMICSPSVA